MLVSIFTPTYNRANFLNRLYASLCIQTIQKFEWIIIDDESADNTDEVINNFIKEAKIPIKYLKQSHGGKHRAINLGLTVAEGEFFFIVDSDDYLVENAMEFISSAAKSIEVSKNIVGFAGLRIYPDGICVGEKGIKNGNLPYIDCGNLDRLKNMLLGDKAEIFKTSLLKQYKFPEIDGETFMTERYIWDKISSDGFILRWYNTPIYVCDYLEEGLTKSGANSLRGHINNFKGYTLYIKQSMRIQDPLESVTMFREYNKTARIMRLNIRDRAQNIEYKVLEYLFYYFFKMPVLYFKRKIFYWTRR